MIDQERDITVVVFGKGDVSVSLKEYPTTNYPKITLQNCEKTKIGDQPEDLIKSSPLVTMVFMNKESLEVLIEKLQEARETFD